MPLAIQKFDPVRTLRRFFGEDFGSGSQLTLDAVYSRHVPASPSTKHHQQFYEAQGDCSRLLEVLTHWVSLSALLAAEIATAFVDVDEVEDVSNAVLVVIREAAARAASQSWSHSQSNQGACHSLFDRGHTALCSKAAAFVPNNNYWGCDTATSSVQLQSNWSNQGQGATMPSHMSHLPQQSAGQADAIAAATGHSVGLGAVSFGGEMASSSASTAGVVTRPEALQASVSPFMPFVATAFVAPNSRGEHQAFPQTQQPLQQQQQQNWPSPPVQPAPCEYLMMMPMMPSVPTLGPGSAPAMMEMSTQQTQQTVGAFQPPMVQNAMPMLLPATPLLSVGAPILAVAPTMLPRPVQAGLQAGQQAPQTLMQPQQQLVSAITAASLGLTTAPAAARQPERPMVQELPEHPSVNPTLIAGKEPASQASMQFQ
jgi:hypothetical protein